MLFITHSLCCHWNATAAKSTWTAPRTAHTLNEKMEGLRDRERCRINPLCPSCLFTLLSPISAASSSLSRSLFGCNAVWVRGISHDPPLDGSTSRQPLKDTCQSRNKQPAMLKGFGARSLLTCLNSRTIRRGYVRININGPSSCYFPPYFSAMLLHYDWSAGLRGVIWSSGSQQTT